MCRLLLVLLFLCLSISANFGQENLDSTDDLNLQRLWLLSDIKNLETKAKGLEKPLARASAFTEIADAAWTLDEDWAKKLLNDAYLLTLPDEEEQKRLRERPVGAEPQIPTSTNRTAVGIRIRILQIASRNKIFVNQLLQLATDKLGSYDAHLNNSLLASQAFSQGEKEATRGFILQALRSDPTQGTVVSVINEIAARDRTFADELIIQYLDILRTVPLSYQNRSLLRVQVFLESLIFFPSVFGQQVSLPDPAVLKAYSYFVIDRIKQIQEQDPNSLQRARSFLLSAWQPLRNFAPELIGEFSSLELKTRKPGEEAFYPKNFEDIYQKANEKRVQKSQESNQSNFAEINSEINKSEFDKARRLIDKLSDGSQKNQFLEMVNTQEALNFIKKGNLVSADILAQRLKKSVSILKVYPAIIKVCAENEDRTCVTVAGNQAMKQLKNADNTLSPLTDIPSSLIDKNPTQPLVNLSKLSLAVAPSDENLALNILDEMVDTANKSDDGTENGLVGFDVEIFRKLTSKNEIRVRQAAANLQNPLRQTVVFAAIYQVKAKALNDKIKKKM